MKKISWSDFEKIMSDNEAVEMAGVIVYREDNWKTSYPLAARSYKVSNQNKYFQSDMCGSSLYGSSLDGSDKCVRLDYYGWKVDYCYILEN